MRREKGSEDGTSIHLKMELRYISIKCPICGRIWGSTEEYTEQFSYDAEEVSEYRLCPICRSRKKNVKQTPVEVK